MRRTKKQLEVELKYYKVKRKGDRWIGFIKCPDCKVVLKKTANEKYYLLRNLRKVEKNKSKCRTCMQTGEFNHFFGKIHTKETKKKQSENRIGKACGKNNSMNNLNYRKKVSKALKKKYDSGELDYLKEIQRKNAIKNQANGKLKNAPVSKAEIEIKEYLENKCLKVVPQFNIDSLKYDLFIKNKNLLIEYNGDYWHCNPEKYDKNYLHKKKNMTAEEIWKRDEYKKQLALNSGFNFITIWEKDYKLNKNKELNKILI